MSVNLIYRHVWNNEIVLAGREKCNKDGRHLKLCTSGNMLGKLAINSKRQNCLVNKPTV